MPPIHKWERLLRRYLGQKLIFCLCSILDYDHEVFFFFYYYYYYYYYGLQYWQFPFYSSIDEDGL